MWRWMMAAGTALAFASGCSDEGMDTGEREHSGLDNVRAGLEMAQQGMDRHDDGEPRGLGMMRDGMAMMRTGMDGMRSGFGCGGTVGAVMAPMDEGIEHMQEGVDRMGESAQDDDGEGTRHFREGSGQMADGIDRASQMACMGHGFAAAHDHPQ